MGRSAHTADELIKAVGCPPNLRAELLSLGTKLLDWRFDEKLGLWWMGPIPKAESVILRWLRSWEGVEEVLQAMFELGWFLAYRMHIAVGHEYPEMRHVACFVKWGGPDDYVFGSDYGPRIKGTDMQDTILMAALEALKNGEAKLPG